VSRPRKPPRYTVIPHPDAIVDVAALAIHGPEVVAAAEAIADDLAHGRVIGKELGIAGGQVFVTGATETALGKKVLGAPVGRYVRMAAVRSRDPLSSLSPGSYRSDRAELDVVFRPTRRGWAVIGLPPEREQTR
jgi:hypothetical protein